MACKHTPYYHMHYKTAQTHFTIFYGPFCIQIHILYLMVFKSHSAYKLASAGVGGHIDVDTNPTLQNEKYLKYISSCDTNCFILKH